MIKLSPIPSSPTVGESILQTCIGKWYHKRQITSAEFFYMPEGPICISIYDSGNVLIDIIDQEDKLYDTKEESPNDKPIYIPRSPTAEDIRIKEQLSPPTPSPTSTELEKIVIPLPSAAHPPQLVEGIVDQSGSPILLDSSQERAIHAFRSRSSYSILGKAGTGKTTTVQAIALDYLSSHNLTDPSNLVSYRIKGAQGERVIAPSMAVIAYTNRAANNIRNKLCSHPIVAEHFGYNVTTAHNLLEYSIEFYPDPETGENKRRYFPLRDATNPLTISHLVIEEATLIGVGPSSIWQQLFDALPSGVQLIFLGDINQLPPVIGKSILNYAVQTLPIVELDKVHRQALENPIIRQALNCIEGRPLVEDYNPKTEQGVRLFQGKGLVKMGKDLYDNRFGRLVRKLIEAGQYDPLTDMILCPYNKPSAKCVNAQDLGKDIATYLAHKAESDVYEIKAGFTNIYLRVGDKVFIEKEEGLVTSIRHNMNYYGKTPKSHSKDLTYHGNYFNEFKLAKAQAKAQAKALAGAEVDPFEHDEYDYSNFSLDSKTEEVEEDSKKRASSHIVEVTLDSGQIVLLSQAGQFSDFQLGYSLSVHKAQGSEWNRVILALHDTNATLLFRELLYTAMTRPRIRLDIIAQKHILEKCRNNQRIKGKTLSDKIEFFNGGYLDLEVEIQP